MTDKPTWVLIFHDDQQSICVPCAEERIANGERVSIMKTLRVGADTGACVDCRKFRQRIAICPAPTMHEGVAYFPTFEAARDFGGVVGRGYPAWRVVNYKRGWAVQTRPSGPYFSEEGKAS